MVQADVRWVKIAPGPGGQYWDDCLTNGYIRVGWDEVGDLRRFGSREEYLAEFRERYPDEQPGQLWTVRELNPGDRVVANRGFGEILAVGTVREPGYMWLGDKPEYNHAVAVAWDTSLARSIEDVKGWRRTVLELDVSFVRDVLPEALSSDAMTGETGETAISTTTTLGRAIDDVMGLLARGGEAADIRAPLRQLVVGTIPKLLRPLLPTDYRVEGSIGFGNIADVPWVTLMPPNTSPQNGHYAVFLFAADGENAYLSLNQGTQRVERTVIRKRALDLRTVARPDDPRLLDAIDLGSSNTLPRKYEAGNAFALRYERGAVPDESTLADDVALMTTAIHTARDAGIDLTKPEPIHLLLKWALRSDVDTIEEHREIDVEHGSVWWGKFGDPERTSFSAGNLERLRQQISAGTPTHVYLHRAGSTWRARLLEVTINPAEVDEDLLPSYYSKDGSSNLFVHISGMEELPKDWAVDHLLVASNPDPERVPGALGNQSPLLVFERQGLVSEANFDEQWTRLVKLVSERGGWRTLVQEVEARVVETGDEFVDYETERAPRDRITKSRVRGAWDEARAQGAVGPNFRTAIKAFVALFPNIEYELPGLRLHWADPPSHVLGTAKQWRAASRSEPIRAGDRRAELDALADALCLDRTYVHDIDWLLRSKQQLVFHGPPGTGKTFVAQAFAEWFTGSPERVELVQFHPSYAYEDFVEGIRPTLVEEPDEDAVDEEDPEPPPGGSALTYRLVPGLLKRFASRARADEDNRYVLIIDEINRANLPRVFGELLFLLEYRKRQATLPYSQRRFGLPPNLYLMGTMNTADRSIALVDFALRRRFHFLHFPANSEILRRWLRREMPSMTRVADYLRYVNDSLGASDFAIGFSYFMDDTLTDASLERIWRHSIVPALAEYYFNDPKRVAGFELAAVRAAVDRPPAADGDGAGEPDNDEGTDVGSA